MGRNKLFKFEALRQLEFVYENKDHENPQLTDSKNNVVDLKGKWCTEHARGALRAQPRQDAQLQAADDSALAVFGDHELDIRIALQRLECLEIG